jgi:hypothetical protein
MSVPTTTSGPTAAAATRRQEAVMGKAIPAQHPAVVLRSHYQLVRALLAVAMIAVVGLTVALVIVADDGDEITGTTSARPIESINYGGFNPATGRPHSAPLPRDAALPARKLDGVTDGIRYDGGAEEGTRGIRQSSAASPAQVYVNPSTGYAGTGSEPGNEEDTRAPNGFGARP